MYSLNIKFQEKIFTSKKVIQLWNFGNFGTSEIIPKNLVTLRFLKVSLHELKGTCKCFQMRFWPNFYVDPTYSNTCFFKVGKRRVLLQGTVQMNTLLASRTTTTRFTISHVIFLMLFSFAYFVLKKKIRTLMAIS